MATRGRSSRLRFAAPTSRGTEPLLAAELRSFGIHRAKEGPGVVEFHGGLREGYRALLWSRIASRVLLQLSRFDCRDADELYAGVRAIDWAEHLDPDHTLAVDFVGTSRSLRHSGFAALRTKDAIVDSLRDATGRRPNVDTVRPDLRINVYLSHAVATVSLDLAGRPLHERGEPGRRAGAAPLKETLAAAILHAADWPRQAARGAPFVDPMCGAGTLPLEAAGIALDQAPNLERRSWGFDGWRGHEEDTWVEELTAAFERRDAALGRTVSIQGWDRDLRVLDSARENARRLGLIDVVRFSRRGWSDAVAPPGADAAPRGVLATNPPYGERLGKGDDLEGLYRAIGDGLKRRFPGWSGWVFTGSRQLAGCIGLKATSRLPLWNGRIECRLLEFPMRDELPTGQGPGWRGD